MLLRILAAFVLLTLSCGAWAQLASGAWPKIGGNSLNTGVSPFSGAVDILKWTFFFAPIKDSGRSPAVSNGNTVYIAGTSGNIYALDGNTGDVDWQYAVGEVSFSTPAIAADGTVYIGTDPGNVYAFNGATGGKPLWTAQPSGTDGESVGPPAIGPDGTVYVGCLNGKLYALNGATGATKWSFDEGPTAVNYAQDTCPAITADGTLYLGGSNTVYAVNGSTGAQIWKFTGGANLFTSVTLGPDGTVYVGSSDNYVYALDGSTGTYKWSFVTGGAVYSTPTLSSDGTIYIGSDDGYLYVIDAATGVKKWTFNAGSMVESSVAIAGDGTIYVCSSGGVMYALNGATGRKYWAFNANGWLYDPAIGPDGSVYVADAGGNLYAFYAGIYPISLTLNPTTVLGGGTSTGTIVMSDPAPPGGLVVNLTSDLNCVIVPSAITIPAGQTTTTFTANTSVVTVQKTAQVAVIYNGLSQTATLTVNPIAVTSLSITPTSLQGGASAVGTVTLNEPAPPGGAVVTLSSNNQAANVASTVVVPAGQSSTTFPIATNPVFASVTATVTASISGGNQFTASLTVLPPLLISIAFDPTTVPGGAPSTGTLTISSIAPAGGMIVFLSTNNGVVVVPTSVTIPAGSVSTTFSVVSNFEIQQVSTIVSATLAPVTVSAPLTITPSVLAGFQLNPTIVAGGAPSTGTITLSIPAPSGGAIIALSNNTLGVTLPASVTVPAGQKTASFTIQTPLVVAQFIAKITATYDGITQAANLTLNPLALTTLTLSPTTVVGGAGASGTVALNGPAPAGGFVVALSSSNSLVTVPGSVTILAGQASASFQVSTGTVTSKATSTITAVLNGESPVTATLTVVPSVLSSLTFSPSPVVGGNTVIGTITLTGGAPPGGFTVGLSTKSAAMSIPASVTIAVGQASATFTAHTSVVSQLTVAAAVAALHSVTITTSLTIQPASLESLSVNPASVQGGATSTGTATLNGPAPKGGLVVKLSSSQLTVTVPSSVTVVAGKMAATFQVKTTAVGSNLLASITGVAGTVAQGASLTVTAPTLVSITLSPNSLSGGKSSTGTVTISGAAPKGGIVVNLLSSLTSATVPSAITIPAGKTAITFTVKTVKVGTKSTATITGTLSNSSKTATLTIS